MSAFSACGRDHAGDSDRGGGRARRQAHRQRLSCYSVERTRCCSVEHASAPPALRQRPRCCSVERLSCCPVERMPALLIQPWCRCLLAMGCRYQAHLREDGCESARHMARLSVRPCCSETAAVHPNRQCSGCQKRWTSEVEHACVQALQSKGKVATIHHTLPGQTCTPPFFPFLPPHTYTHAHTSSSLMRASRLFLCACSCTASSRTPASSLLTCATRCSPSRRSAAMEASYRAFSSARVACVDHAHASTQAHHAQPALPWCYVSRGQVLDSTGLPCTGAVCCADRSLTAQECYQRQLCPGLGLWV